MGTPAYGWRILPRDSQDGVPWCDGRSKEMFRLAPNEHEQAIIAEAKRLRALGWAATRIASAFAKRGYKNRLGKPFAAAGVRRMLAVSS